MQSISISQTVLTLLAGLGLFLLGMQNMSDGLQKSVGDRLKRILGKLTGNRIVGVGVGTLVTAVIQSSSATTVMVVGFVNAGIISLTQALSVILGANIGTTVTGQIIAFKVTTLSLPFIALGAVLFIFFKKKPYVSYLGQLILGLGLIFYGMNMMTGAFKPLAALPEFKNLFVYFSDNMILAVLAGTVLTLILQSSSATMGITMALSTTGVLSFPAAAALILGENIGTTITANLAALGANRTAKQAAFGHFLFNLIGVIYMLILIHPLISLINFITPGDYAYFDSEAGIYPYVARHLANYHTMFNIINTIVFLPILPLLAKLCEAVIKPSVQEESEPGKVPNLAIVNIPTPDFAVSLAQEETAKVFKIVSKIYEMARVSVPIPSASPIKSDDKIFIESRDLLDRLHQYVDEIKAMLSRLSVSSSVAKGTRDTVLTMLKELDEIETLGERARKLVKTSVKFYEQDEAFSEEAKKELENILTLVDQNFYGFEAIFNGNGQNADLDQIAERKVEVERLKKEYKRNHLHRLSEEACSFRAGILFNSLLDTLEKIASLSLKLTRFYVR